MSNNQEDSFSYAPLFSLLPERGSIDSLQKYAIAYFARTENIQSIIDSSETANAEVSTELAMLKQVLQWSNLQSEFEKQKDVES